MRRALAALAGLLLLAGCESFGDLTSDAFDPGNMPQSRFRQDNAYCAAKAELKRSYDLQGIYGTHAERHEAFNRAYAACMRENGYALRGWSPDIAFPYDIDPTPG